MPFNLLETDCSPLLSDYEFEIADRDLLVQYVAEMLLGHHYHVLRIIRTFSATWPIHPNESIDHIIDKLNGADTDKRDGWIFQMISWIVLAKRNAHGKFFSNHPHFAPAQHGIDGLAIILDENNGLKQIVITEDKCTIGPRNKITQQVFPEFLEFEAGKKNNALLNIISSLTSNLDDGKALEAFQNNIFENAYRLYRIGITRADEHNTVEGRNRLFKDYDLKVVGAVTRRSASTIHIPDLRRWMTAFAQDVITYLKSKKTPDVQ